MSKRSRDAIQATLAKHYSQVSITIINTPEDLNQLITNKPDLVFLGMKFVPVVTALAHNEPNKFWISEFLDNNNINYTGSSKSAHIRELNKDIAKDLMIEAGISTADFYLAKRDQPSTWKNQTLKYPVFIKPSNRGGGLGIDDCSIAYNQDAINYKASSVADKLRSDILVEEYLSGQEYSVAILGRPSSDDYDSMAVQLSTNQDGSGVSFISSTIKQANSEVVKVVSDYEMSTKLSTLALGAFHALGGRDYGRIDVRLDCHGEPHFLEANLLPSLIEDYGSFPKACVLNEQINYETMILNIVDLAFARNSQVREFNLEKNVVPVTSFGQGLPSSANAC